MTGQHGWEETDITETHSIMLYEDRSHLCCTPTQPHHTQMTLHGLQQRYSLDSSGAERLHFAVMSQLCLRIKWCIPSWTTWNGLGSICRTNICCKQWAHRRGNRWHSSAAYSHFIYIVLQMDKDGWGFTENNAMGKRAMIDCCIRIRPTFCSYFMKAGCSMLICFHSHCSIADLSNSNVNTSVMQNGTCIHWSVFVLVICVTNKKRQQNIPTSN